MRKLICLLSLAGLLAAASPASAQWGDLKLRVSLKGAAPKPKSIQPTKDPAFCGQFKILDESLVVNAKNNGIANVIVYIYLKRGAKTPPIHPSFAKGGTAAVASTAGTLKSKQVAKLTAAGPPLLDNKGCRFAPHVLFVRTGQQVLLGNDDQVGHNTKIDFFVNQSENTLIPAGKRLKRSWEDPESLPTGVSCNIHPWMNAWLVLKDHPYMGATDANGALTLKNVPAGKWTFQFWQEKAGYLSELGKRGRKVVTIKNGSMTDLGDLKVSLKQFKK